MKNKYNAQLNGRVATVGTDKYLVKTRHRIFNDRQIEEVNKTAITEVALHKITEIDDDNIIKTFDDKASAKGVAQCSLREQFNRKLGRAIAVGRAVKELK